MMIMAFLFFLLALANATQFRTKPAAGKIQKDDGVCSKYTTNGYHFGTYITDLPASSSPSGIAWQWRDCAKECVLHPDCEFWTLQKAGDKKCILMKDQTGYSDTGGHFEGERDEDCIKDLRSTEGGYSFVWSDEFNGPGINASVWGFEEGYVRNHEAQFYSTRKENSRIERGNMLIEARRDNWNGHQYTSASRTTKGKKSFLYGMFSLRARIDIRKGSWPAWWWLPVEKGWPKGGEVDMMEYYKRKFHFGIYDGEQKWTTVSARLHSLDSGNFSDHYHTWTWEWSSERIKLYLDGVLMNDYDVSDADGTGWNGENPFRQPGYLLLNQAIGGTAGGDPSGTSFPVKFYIDWVRQWEWDPSAIGQEVIVTNGAGSGMYVKGTHVTIAAGPPPLGKKFQRWLVEKGRGVVLDDASSEHTTMTVPAGGATVTAIYKDVGSTASRNTPQPASPGTLDGVCSKYETKGWHRGTYLKTLGPHQAPNGIQWKWRQCAKECALVEECEFWTLQRFGTKFCLLLSNQGEYVVAKNHVEGSKDMECLKAHHSTDVFSMEGGA